MNGVHRTGLPERGSLLIPKGQTSATISYQLLQNGTEESEKYISIILEGPSNAYENVIVGDRNMSVRTIIDDDIGNYTAITELTTNAKGSANCAITNTGAIKCWGDNTKAFLGTTSSAEYLTTATAFRTHVFKSVSIGQLAACGLTTENELACWVSNQYDQVGDGSGGTNYSPVFIDLGTKYTMVTSGYTHSCGITTGGVLKCWGANASYDLGDGTNVQKNSPTIIDSGVSYQKVSIGYTSACAITTANKLRCWGANSAGQVGDGTTVTKSTPVEVDSASDYQFVFVSRQYNSVCAITTAGVLKCWGQNTNRNLGDGTTTQKTSPTIIDSGTSYKLVTVGMYNSCGIINKCVG